MHGSRAAGVALIAGTSMGLVTMALHPTGAALLRDLETVGPRNLFAHALAIAAVPLLLLGTDAASRRLRAASPALAPLGRTIYWVASFAVLIAGVASGLVGPAVAERIVGAGDVDATLWRAIFSYNGMINQGFALVYVAGLGAAIFLWSLAMWRTRLFARAIAGLGVVLGVALVAAVLAGLRHLDVHTFGLIVIAQALWMYAVGATLARGTDDGREGA
jgi:hypothetical protein